MPTAAAVIIGNEILTGKFADENGPYLISRLRTLGCDLRRLVTIDDDVQTIAAEVRACSEAHDVVFTTGGVGPTHDDVTLEGIAAAFDVELEVRDELLTLLDSYGLPRNDAALRMVTLPTGSELVATEPRSYPVVVVRNVYVFPGVPKLMRAKFETVAHRFAGEPVRTARLYTTDRETQIAADLSEVQRQFPRVDIGSYPRFGDGSYRVIVTLESRDDAALAQAVSTLEERLKLVQPSEA